MLARKRGSPEIIKVSRPTKNDANRSKKLRSKTRKGAFDSDKRVAKRTGEYFRKKE